jgi:hypothetical protein
MRERFAAIEREMEFEDDIREEERKAIERLRKQAESAKRAAEDAKMAAKELKDETERQARLELVEPVLAFSNALTQHLGPALSFVEQAMQRVNDVFQSFVDGQMSLTEAVAGSAHAITRAVAEQVGGVKALAAVDAAYHLYKGFGTAFTNPAESAGHFVAAAGLGLVAAGIIPTGTAGAKKPDQRGIGRREESQASDTGEKTVVYNISAGVMDGQSVSRAVRQSERSSRGTGYSARGV